MNSFYKIIKGEETLFKIKKKSEIGFWHYQILGLFSYFVNKSSDYLIITDRRILIVIKDEILNNIEYKDFPKIKYNSISGILSFQNTLNKTKNLSLKKLRLTYEEIQLLKKKLDV